MNFLKQIIIFPLQQILDFFFMLIYEITDNEGLAIIGLSFVVTLCTLPLYLVAEKWQDAERQKQSLMKPGIKRIKQAFKGDEQYMILNTFYKQNHYHPLMALRSSLSLIIQIPFFIAAYDFISHLEILQGYSFFIFKDFGSPDNTFFIGNLPINILPIFMTIINCISGALYSKGHDKKEKIQIYVMAAFFLVLLYNSPSGLVIYWTMNNILSLVKNIFAKVKIQKKVINLIKEPITNFFNNNFTILDTNQKLRNLIFIFSCIGITLLCGLVIPSIIIESEPTNYCFVDDISSPFTFLSYSFWQAVGCFIFWPIAFYCIFSKKIKKICSVLFSSVLLCSIINTFIFGGKYGPMEADFIFMQTPSFHPFTVYNLLNLFIIFSIIAVLFISLNKVAKYINFMIVIIIMSLSAIFINTSLKINNDYKQLSKTDATESLEPIYHLSKTGKNVIIIMQDNLQSPYIPYVLDELPELSQKLDGFKWYPNTISNGYLTMAGVPGIFAGYDYTPYQMNLNLEKDNQTKHNEALLTLPLIFSKNGYHSSVSNLPYENYYEQPESNMYLANPSLQKIGIELENSTKILSNVYTIKYKNHNTITHNNVKGVYTDYWFKQNNLTKDNVISTKIKRNILWFSIFKISPSILRKRIYHSDYWSTYSNFHSSDNTFINSWSVLDYLPELTDFYTNSLFEEKTNGSCILIDNETTHDPIMLDSENYEYKPIVNTIGKGPLSDSEHFTTLCGTFLKFADFIEYLKVNSVYDNTKIIIVSDHCRGITQDFTTELLGCVKNDNIDNKKFLSTLLIKDFNSHGDFIAEKVFNQKKCPNTDYTFMTNADVSYLATKDIIPNAKNPFTNNPLKVENKNDYAILNNGEAESTKNRHNKQFNVKDSEWYTVKDNIFIDENWGKLYN